MWKRYGDFLRRPPEVSIAWHDVDTGARAWLIINSLRGGAAGGGTRMRPGVSPREVVYLAKAMELKFALAGPAIGGAKTGIDFDPHDPRKPRVLERWYRVIRPYLRAHYGTGGDLNVDELTEVIPTFERLGLLHPQQGVVRGHFDPDDQRFARIIEHLDVGVKARVADRHGIEGGALTVADMATGYGVASAIRRWYERQGQPLDGVRVMLEGFGNVGAGAALYLARAGARIVSVMDAEKALIEPDGLAADEIAGMMRNRPEKLLPADDPRLRRGVERETFWEQPAEVFIAAALSGTITDVTLDRLAARGVRVIASGANQPFREFKLGSTRVQQRADRRFTILADVLANCGMARAFSYLMEPDALPEGEAVLAAIERTVVDALDEVVERGEGRTTGLLAETLGLALERVGG
jgi:glutamate dehydrogenase/leucine dehydrogenase